MSPIAASSLNDIFEAYVLTLVIRAARDEGAMVNYINRDGTVATSMLFRTSPGFIYSSAKNYTHAVITFPDKPSLEAHIGVKVAGKSGVLHELDVAVMERAEAENCRRNSVSPRSNKVLVGVECKFYASSLQLHLARGFVGLVNDLSVKSPFFVTNTSSASVEKLLSHRVKHGWEKEISPACKNTEVERLVHAFRACFKNFKAQ
ncbi:hypothetical protein HTY52_18475 [Cupriavidus taiwanensis]|uniref:hypothetical protein n=1 Tax=Cupriavidus taiwanensis TaxID=164546 RepID=UPI001571641A|nr:hypothetical protein [Cupriavidus taiwanensis]NSX16074.1 hypothetical protein [Cupriavidus taiwanensis]